MVKEIHDMPLRNLLPNTDVCFDSFCISDSVLVFDYPIVELINRRRNVE